MLSPDFPILLSHSTCSLAPLQNEVRGLTDERERQEFEQQERTAELAKFEQANESLKKEIKDLQRQGFGFSIGPTHHHYADPKDQGSGGLEYPRYGGVLEDHSRLGGTTEGGVISRLDKGKDAPTKKNSSKAR